MIEVRESRPSDVAALAPKLRDTETAGGILLGMRPQRLLWQTYRRSVLRKTALLDDEIAAMWGCGGALLGGIGEPWLFMSGEAERVPRAVLRLARIELQGMRAVFGQLRGVVQADNARARRFAERLGCRIEDGTGSFLWYEVGHAA